MHIVSKRHRGMARAIVGAVALAVLSACGSAEDPGVTDAPADDATAPADDATAAGSAEASGPAISEVAAFLEGTLWKYEVVGWRFATAPDGKTAQLSIGEESFFYDPETCASPGLSVSLDYGVKLPDGRFDSGYAGWCLGVTRGTQQGQAFVDEGAGFECVDESGSLPAGFSTVLAPGQVACVFDRSILIVGPSDGSGPFETVEFSKTYLPSRFEGEGTWDGLAALGYTSEPVDRLGAVKRTEGEIVLSFPLFQTYETFEGVTETYGVIVDARLTPL